MPAARGCSRPCCGGSNQQRRRQRKGQDDRTAARSRQGRLGIRNDAVDATLCVGRRKARNRSYLLNQVGSVVGTDALMAGGGQKDAACFRTLGA